MKTVLITGGSGLVGQRLTQLLIDKGYNVIWLSRYSRTRGPIYRYKWDYRNGVIDKEALHNADYIIHLAGENIGEKSWSSDNKKTIVDSRVKTAKLIYDALQEIGKKPEAFISASAVGYYGLDVSDKIYTEDDIMNGFDFLSTTCQKWEAMTDKISNKLKIRTVILRTGVVLSPDSEAFKKMMAPVKLGVGSALGRGNQFLSWIYIDDLCNMYIKAIEDVDMQGVYNAVAPEYVTNASFMRRLAKAMRRPFFMPRIPSFVMRIVMGEAADLVLGGSRVSADKIIKAGFKFKYPNVDEAIISTLSASRSDS